MLSKHERYYGLGMDAFGTDALVSRMRWKTVVMTVWVWSKNGLTEQYTQKRAKMGLGKHGTPIT